MPVEEHKELRELVSHTLQAKGVLQKVQAEIRASVFLALEEQDVFKDKNPFINIPLKNYLSTTEGLLAVSLIKEFLDFFNLEFTSMVFDPETHAGIDYTYECRQKIANNLKIDIIDGKVPLLGLLLKLLTSSKKSETSYSNHSTTKKDISKNDERSIEENDILLPNGINGTINKKETTPEDKEVVLTEASDPRDNNIESENRTKVVTSSLASLGDLPPLTKPKAQTTSAGSGYKQQNTAVAKTDIPNYDGSQYNDDDMLLPSPKNNRNAKNDAAISEESEIEEDISEAASGHTDDNTVDLSISKVSGKADYLEDIQSSHLLD